MGGHRAGQRRYNVHLPRTQRTDYEPVPVGQMDCNFGESRTAEIVIVLTCIGIKSEHCPDEPAGNRTAVIIAGQAVFGGRKVFMRTVRRRWSGRVDRHE